MLSNLYEKETSQLKQKFQTTQAKLIIAETKITALEEELDNLKSNKADARQPQRKSSYTLYCVLIGQESAKMHSAVSLSLIFGYVVFTK